jgi:hypothetical protein
LCYEADRVNKSPESIVFTWIFPTGGVLWNIKLFYLFFSWRE